LVDAKMDVVRTLKLTPEQDSKLVSLAQKNNLTVSEYMRQKLGLGRRGKKLRRFFFV